MEVIILKDPQAVIDAGAKIVEEQVRRVPSSVLGLATGGTMEGLYADLARRELDFSQVRSFNLDEYVGLDAQASGSYAHYMREHLFDHINIPSEKTHLLDGTTNDIPAHCQAYDKAIVDCGGIDLQLLGIGHDGHIAFNEPGSSLASRTRLKTLTPDTLACNAPHFPTGKSVPLHVLTVGIATIMEARHCLLLAYGSSKAPALQGAIEGPITASCPASILQMHPFCTVIIDETAAQNLARADYYRFVYENKPENSSHGL